MNKEALTAKQIQFVKPHSTKRLEIPVGAPPGFYIVVHPSGKKSWALRYRWHGRPTKLTFSKSYPDLSLAAARAEAEAALSKLERGIDPAAAKAEEEREPNSVREAATEWLARYVKPSTRTRTQSEFERILKCDVLPAWDKKLLPEIGRADVLRLLDAIVDRGAPISANRTFEVLRSWFNWCVGRGLVSVSPVAGIRPPSAEKSRERVLTEEELPKVWNAAEEIGYPFGPFLRLLILTAQRRGEVAAMRWQDVDLVNALWTLPPEATKAGRIHDVPLSDPALSLLKGLPRFDGPFVFTTTSGTKPINGFSKAKKAVDTAILNGSDAGGEKLNDWTIHDLRRTAATQMASASVPPHVLSALLNHTPGSQQGVTAIYNRFRYEKERREALQKWGEYVVSLAKPGRKLAVS